jgi:hypothetical protein
MAALATDYLASTRGPDTPWRLMRLLRDDKSLASPADATAALEAALGMSTTELFARAMAWARSA